MNIAARCIDRELRPVHWTALSLSDDPWTDEEVEAWLPPYAWWLAGSCGGCASSADPAGRPWLILQRGCSNLVAGSLHAVTADIAQGG